VRLSENSEKIDEDRGGASANRLLALVEVLSSIGDAEVTLTVFITEKDFGCLSRAVPVGSHSKRVLAQADHFASAADTAGNYVLTCEENEARNLLMYARVKCPGAAASILEALRAVGVSPE
jgi:hypothetical protein